MLVPDWSQKGSRPQGSFGQYTQSNMFTNPTYEQQGKPQQLANMLRQMPMQGMQNSMQPQPYQAAIQQQPNMISDPTNQMGQNWGSQYGGY